MGTTLSTGVLALSSRVLCGLDMTMTPSVIQSSDCCLRRTARSPRPMPSFPCSSSMSRSCELLLFTMMGPILRRSSPSLYMGCTLGVSLVRRMTDFSCKSRRAEGGAAGAGGRHCNSVGLQKTSGNSWEPNTLQVCQSTSTVFFFLQPSHLVFLLAVDAA